MTEYDSPHHSTASLRALLAQREYHLAELIDEVRYAEGRRAEAVRLAESRAVFAHKLEAALQGMMRLYVSRNEEYITHTPRSQASVPSMSAHEELQASLKELLYEGISAETRPLLTRTLAQLALRSRSTTPRTRSISSATSPVPALASHLPSPLREDKKRLTENEARLPPSTASSLMHTQAELSALLASLQQEASASCEAQKPPWLPQVTTPSTTPFISSSSLASRVPQRAAPAPLSGRSSASSIGSTIRRYNSTQSPHSLTHASPYTNAALSAERSGQRELSDEGTPYHSTLHDGQRANNNNSRTSAMSEQVRNEASSHGESSPLSYRRSMQLLSPAPVDVASQQSSSAANIRVLSSTLPSIADGEQNHIHSLEAVVRLLKSDLQVMQERINTSIT